MRNHLANLIKYRDQAGGRDRSDLSNPATWEVFLETRFEQVGVGAVLSPGSCPGDPL